MRFFLDLKEMVSMNLCVRVSSTLILCLIAPSFVRKI